MSRSVIEYFLHIRQELEYLKIHSANQDYESFSRDETLKRAFSRSLEIIGEAIKNVPDDVKSKYPEVGWKAITGMRDKLIHHYFGVDYELVWDIVENEIDELLFQVDVILKEEGDSENIF